MPSDNDRTSSPRRFTIDPEQVLRDVLLEPYGPHSDSRFRLILWDTYALDAHGRHVLGYRLILWEKNHRTVLFEGDDLHVAQRSHVALDSDEVLMELLAFLTICPGDTDPAYFEKYTPVQRDYCATHAENLRGYAEPLFDHTLYHAEE